MCQEKNVSPRAALYVDGFNLYYPIVDMGDAGQHLKWASLWRLGQLFSEPNDATLVKAVLCTAVPAHYPDKRDRHIKFNNAQRACGVTVINGHHIFDGEKQTDINLALALILDGLDNVYDIAFLLSADSDQAATARTFRERMPHKRLVSIAPPNRPVSDKVRTYADASFTMRSDLLERSVMPATLDGKSGLIHRPEEYCPPVGWVHPDNRPKGKGPKLPKKWGKAVKAE